jgi:hypothetical protein
MSGERRRKAKAPASGEKCPVCRIGTFRQVQTRWGPEWWCSMCQPRIARLEPEDASS